MLRGLGGAAVHDEFKFHSERAMAEIDRASNAADYRSARLHLDLSALHLERMRALCEGQPAGATRDS